MIINDLDGYYIVFDTKNWNTELDTLLIYGISSLREHFPREGFLFAKIVFYSVIRKFYTENYRILYYFLN